MRTWTQAATPFRLTGRCMPSTTWMPAYSSDQRSGDTAPCPNTPHYVKRLTTKVAGCFRDACFPCDKPRCTRLGEGIINCKDCVQHPKPRRDTRGITACSERFGQSRAHELALGEFELAIRGLLGEGAPLSPASLQLLQAQWHQEYETWTP